MSTINEIHERLRRSYAALESSAAPAPLNVQAVTLGAYAREYSKAASLVDAGAPNLFLPTLQLAGHAVELALKACPAASGVAPPKGSRGQDLVGLYRRVEATGASLSEFEQAALVHLSHFYFNDLCTTTRFKSRYPPESMENVGGSVPSQHTYESIVESLLDQAGTLQLR